MKFIGLLLLWNNIECQKPNSDDISDTGIQKCHVHSISSFDSGTLLVVTREYLL
jgi:hypothetical protein